MLKRLKECLQQKSNVVIYVLRLCGNNKRIAFWTCLSRILMHHPTFIGNRKQSFFPMSAKRRRNISKPVWTNAVTSLPLWFHVMQYLEMKPRWYSTVLQNLAGSLVTSNVMKDEHCNFVRVIHQCIRGSRIPTLSRTRPTSPVGKWSRPQAVLRTIRLTRNVRKKRKEGKKTIFSRL